MPISVVRYGCTINVWLSTTTYDYGCNTESYGPIQIATNGHLWLIWRQVRECVTWALHECSCLLNLLTLNAPIATKVVCFSRLLKCLRSLYGKQCGPRSDCSYRSSLFWVHAVCFYVMLGNYLQQMTSADDIFSCIFFLGPIRVKQVGEKQ